MKSTHLRNRVLLALAVVALASSLLGLARTGDWGGLALNFGTEMAGAVVTYLLLELVIGRREERETKLKAKKEELEAKKADLIEKMGSSRPEVAIPAAEELVRHGWHTDGSLRQAWLQGAQLPGVDLIGADLQGAFLASANLQEAFLEGANLQQAILVRANLQGAALSDAKLQKASLTRANLQGASLLGANLQDAEFNEDTTLPDGTKWTPDIDLARFTDPDHPDFWHSEE